MAELRWGILSAGMIAHDFVNAMVMKPNPKHKVVAVGARKLESAEEFAKKFNIPKAYGSYEELVNASDVDVIYVCTWHPFHHSACKLAIAAGKHVLCETPLAMNYRQVDDLLTRARDKGVFLMEGFWSTCFPAMDCVRQKLSEGTIGEVRFLQASLGLEELGRPQATDLKMGGGAAVGLLCYPIMLATMVFGTRPEKIVATGQLTATGADLWETVTLFYSNNRAAQLTSHMGCNLFNQAIIHGSKGIIQMPYLWCPSEVITPTETLSFPFPEGLSDEGMNLPRTHGFVYEQDCVRESIQKGELECPLMTHEHIRIIVEVVDEIRRQLGVVYPEDAE